MDDTKFLKDQLITENDNTYEHFQGKLLPDISLPNQQGNLLRLKRSDTFRLVIYFYSLTGHPNKKLPENWNQIPGAAGCTLENCNFRDNYENFIKLNSLPIGISTQNIEDIKEMSSRLGIQFDILSDFNLEFVNKLNLKTFEINKKVFIKRLTIIVEKNIISKVFFPINSVHNHVNEVIEWLKEN